MNRTKTYFLLAALAALLLAAGYGIGGFAGMAVAFALAAGLNLFSYWNGDRALLRLYGARPAAAADADPRIAALVRDVHALADAAAMPRPRVYLIDSAQPNAFATGRDPAHAALCATTGLLQLLDRAQARAVMAHELAHVKNRDTLAMTLAAAVAGPLLAPLGAVMVRMATSRSRVCKADRLGAQMCGDPRALAVALAKIEAFAHGSSNPVAEAHPATAHLWIGNPLKGRMSEMMFVTHPTTRSRVDALLRMPMPGAPLQA